MVGRPFVSFRQLSLPSGDRPSRFDNLQCDWVTFCQLPSTFELPGELASTSVTFCVTGTLSVWLGEILLTFVNSSCGRKTFCQLPLTFRVAKRPVNFHAAWRQCSWVTLRQLSSTFCVAVTRSVNFSCGLVAFHQIP